MNEVITTALISAATSVISAFLGYRQGSKRDGAEALKTTFESYDFALKSLREDFEHRTSQLQKEIDSLKAVSCFVLNCEERQK